MDSRSPIHCPPMHRRSHRTDRPWNEGPRPGAATVSLGWIAVSVAMAFALGGCASAPNSSLGDVPGLLMLERTSYTRAFDEAVALIANEGMPAVLRDRDGGIIESRPNVSGSLLEPWDWPAGSPSAAFESTVNHQRRRVRFEFMPAGFRPSSGVMLTTEEDPLGGPRTPGSTPSDAAGAVDMSRYEGPIELRVWVYVERAYTPYLQRSAWTFRGRSFARNPEDRRREDDDTTRDRSKWTPVSRDPAMERDILEKLEANLKKA